MTAVALTVVLAAAIGLSLGTLGGGGSILAVPLLLYVADLPAKEAIATSLLVVGATSAVSVLPHARAGRIRWRTGLVFGAAGMVGAYAGGRLAAYLPGTFLLSAFAIIMLATAVAMIHGPRTAITRPVPHELPVLKTVTEGVTVGLVTGLVGAGGGFLVVPALALVGGLPMPIAVGTSLVVIAMKSFAGLAGYLSSVDINWALAGLVTTAAILGSIAGSRLTGRIREDLLRKIFGWFVLTVGTFVLVQQVLAGPRDSPWLWIAIAGAGTGTAAMVVAIRRYRRERTAS